MNEDSVYRLLMQSRAVDACDAFDGHVLASVFAIGASETTHEMPISAAVGISGAKLRGVIERYFPGTVGQLETFSLDGEIRVEEDEQCLRQLLQRSRSTKSAFGSLMVVLLARRATRPNHLWQDLGLVNRSELSRLMQRHFAPLAERNTQDMKWKKFFYRMICRDESYRMCVAPSCSECCDFKGCFGDESGESLLAQARFRMEAPLLNVPSTVA